MVGFSAEQKTTQRMVTTISEKKITRKKCLFFFYFFRFNSLAVVKNFLLRFGNLFCLIRVFINVGQEKYVKIRNFGYHTLCGRFFGRAKNHTKDSGQYYSLLVIAIV